MSPIDCKRGKNWKNALPEKSAEILLLDVAKILVFNETNPQFAQT